MRGRRPSGRGARKHVLVATGATMALVVSCGGGDSANDDQDAAPGALPKATCDQVAELEATEKALVERTVFELDEAALGDLLATRREQLADLADRTSGELGSLLDDQVQSQPAFDEAMLDGWDDDRAALAAGHDDRWLGNRVGEEIERDDGERVRASDFFIRKNMAHDRLVMGCRAPELADGPAQETSEEPPAGRLVFFRPSGKAEVNDGGRLVATDTNGRHERDLASQAPWTPVGQLDAVPTGNHGILVGTRQGDDFGTVVVASSGEVLDSIQRGPGQLACPLWNDDSDKVLGEGNTAYADERRLHLLDLTGGRPSGPVDLPFAAVSCGDFVTDERLVVSDAALSIDDERAVWTVGVDGSDPRQLYTPEDCTTQVGSVDPSGTRVAIAQTCMDPLDDGVWVVDLSGGEADHVVIGHAALPKWSPDGEWLVFGFSPLGQTNRVGVWTARADGDQLREVVEPPAFFPVWLPPDD